MTLFQLGDFTLASGRHSPWKIDCDALTASDWECLAAMAVEILPPFSAVVGVPTGGLSFAAALREHATGGSLVVVADDVWTTGGTMRRFADDCAGFKHPWLGVVAFARAKPAPWCRAVFEMGDPE